MNTNFQHLKLEIQDRIGILSVNRVPKMNSLNKEVLQELKGVLKEIHQDKELGLKGLIVMGEGEKAFIAGADIEEMANLGAQEAKEFALLGQRVGLLLEKLPFPVIAAVHGFALGGGLEMAMSCDFIFCTGISVFGQPEVKLGLIPGFGGTQRLSRLVGPNRAREIIYSGRTFKAPEAWEMGLVLKVFETKEEMLKAAREKLEEMKKNSSLAIAFAKKVMSTGGDLPLPQGLNVELEQFSQIFSSEDMREGTRAFLEKRPPCFQGK